MRVEKDFEEFIGLLNKNNVEYLIVGAYAFGLYARPRNTGDIDIFINSTEKNAGLIINVLKEFGFVLPDIKKDDFLKEGKVVQLGVSPVRIDLLNSIDGVEFNQAYAKKNVTSFGTEKANFISKEDLIENKVALGRPKDLADLEELRKSVDGTH